VAALIASDTEKIETVRVAPQPERPVKCYHEFRYWSSEAMTNDCRKSTRDRGGNATRPPAARTIGPI
jgi:hypothetical protein